MKPTIVPKSPSSALNDNIVFVLGAGVDMDGTATRLCQTLRQDRTMLRLAEVRGLETLSGGRLTFVKAKAEEIDRLRLAELLR